MKKVLFATALTALAACGERVEVPPAHVGKILTKNGYREETVMPSKFRLEACWSYCDKLIVLQASDAQIEEEMRLFMPKDQLNMKFDVRATVSIGNDDKSVNMIFDRIPSSGNKIELDRVYKTYARQKFRGTVRTVMSKYTINDVASNRAALEQEIFDAMRKDLANSPIKVLQLSLSDIQFPEVIVKAKEMAKQREIEIEKTEADNAIKLAKAEAELVLAKKDRLVRLEKARTIKEENELTAKSVTPKYLEYKKLEVLEAAAAGGNMIYVPMDSTILLGKR